MSLQEGGRGRFGTEGNMTLKQEATLLTLKMDIGTKECKECSFRSWKGKEMDLPQSLGRAGRATL